MGNGEAEANTEEQIRLEQDLFRRYAAAGVPILRRTQGYIRGALDQGEPGYVANAYNAARIGAGVEARNAESGLMSRLTGRSGGALLEGLAQAGAAGGRSFIEERSAISGTQAANRIEQRNNLLRLLSGQGATNTSLSAGFGRLGLQSLGLQAQGGDPVFEAVLGLGSAGTAGYLDWLANRNTSGISGFNPNASSTYQGGGGIVDLTGRR